MNTQKILVELLQKGMQLWVEEEQLCFRAPDGGLTEPVRKALSERKSELIRFLGDGRKYAWPSFAQQRLWFLAQLEPNGFHYNLPVVYRLLGQLDLAALEKSLAEIIYRHETLRTTFDSIAGYPVQIVAPFESFELPVIDFSQFPDSERETEVRRLISVEIQRPFDLTCGPLLRASILRLFGQEHILLLNMHHIISDGWSNGIFSREMKALYEAYHTGKPSELVELPIQYADFATWQRQWLQGKVINRQLDYWQQQLRGAPDRLELPTDRPRPAQQTFRGDLHTFTLTKEITDRLQELGQQENATLFMILLAAFNILLCRYSGQDDIVVGSPIANRNRAEIEDLIGFFVNTLVLRNDLSGNPSFRELLRRVREVALGAYAHQDLPFEKLVEELQPERSLNHSPLFQVMFTFQNAPTEDLGLGDAQLMLESIPIQTAKFDLTLFLERVQGGLQGSWEYNTDLFNQTTIERLSRHFECLLQHIVANPEQCISELPLLTEPEWEQILFEWNETAFGYSQICIQELFEAQVARTPEAIALVCGDQKLTYKELNQRANQVACCLVKLEVGPDKAVGILMNRTVEMVVGVLGVLKAGGAYVPLDPSYPKARLAFILEDTGVSIVLSQQSLMTGMPEYNGRVVCLDEEWGLISRESKDNLPRVVDPQNLAYVIYTSGSTGKPKGVAIAHSSAVAMLEWASGVFPTEDLQGVLASTSICFDLSIYELFLPLSQGGSILLAENALHLSSLPMRAYVTLINTVPSVMTELLQAGELPASVRSVNLAGEPLRRALVQKVYAQSQVERVYNLYGPSEDTTYSTYARIARQDNLEPTIGRPINNTRAYILDSAMQPVPVGVAGELYLAGDGLARGYLNRPDLTAQAFIPDPFSTTPGSRLYRTGDRVRWLPSGEIEFLGRLDHQVKLRGFRIELGEIENTLIQHPEVHDTLVIVREDRPGDERLTAYLVSEGGSEPDIRELRHFLRCKLPDYMVPSAFVILETFPLTPNGKIDRHALPAPENVRPEEDYTAPRTPEEEILAEIWGAILGVQRIGIRDNFFYLGGHSLLATQVISRIHQTFQVELPLRSLFEAPTIVDLAVVVTSHLRDENVLTMTPILPMPRQDDPPLSFAQQRLWLLDQLEPGSLAYHMPIAYRLLGSLEKDALVWSLKTIVARHESLRTTFNNQNGQPLQVIAPATDIELPVIDLSTLPDAEREAEAQRIISADRHHPFDLVQGPLFRASLLRLDIEEHILLFNMHHIISDGWSIDVFNRELRALYAAFLSGEPSPLPELPIQYADFAIWQRQWLQNEVLETQLSYWKQHLGSQPPVLELPTDQPRPSIQTYQGAYQHLELSPSLSAELKAFGQQAGTTLFMTLLAAFQVLLQRYSGQDDIVVGTPIANRNRSEVENLIGFFVNTLALRIDLSGYPTFRELLERVREVALGAFAHQDLPFEKLVEELQPERDLSRSPLFQVFFNMINLSQKGLALPGLKVEAMEISGVNTKFDMTLYAIDNGENISLSLLYNLSLFSAGRIAEMLRQFQMLLEQILEHPDEKIGCYSLVTPASQRVLPDPKVELACEWTEPVITRFSRQAILRGNQPAVVDTWENWTYTELDVRSNQLAHYLKAKGVAKGDVIAIYGYRSAALVWAILGTLKTGAAFVILDPIYPASRLVNCLRIAGVRGILHVGGAGEIQPELLDFLESLDQYCYLELPNLRDAVSSGFLDDYSHSPMDVFVDGDDPAYIAFTSGTTGQPRGILGTHRPLAHFLDWHAQTFDLAASDRFSMFSGLAHDPLLRDIFTPLCIGATLHIPDPNFVQSADKLAAWMREREISITHLTPALGRLLTTSPDEIKLLALRYAFFGGDVLSQKDIAQFRILAPAASCVNFYGATETPQAMGYYIIPESGTVAKSTIPLGQGIQDAQLLVLNPDRQPAGIGELGEICVRTPYLAQGYVGDTKTTNQRFIPNPWTNKIGDRIYCTGDLGRYQPDGLLSFAGRADHQVKLRGYRIELGEIETTLRQYSEIRDCLVVVNQDKKGEKRLVAYLVGSESLGSITDQLRAYLKEKLPEYMLPAAYIVLEALPLTPSGKIDRRALPAPQSFELQVAGYEPPATPKEEILAGIWGQLLGLARVSVQDNFFELGGHSLLATQVISRVRQIFQVELPLQRLFQSPTVRGLAEQINGRKPEDQIGSVQPIVRSYTQTERPLSFAQRRLWFLEQLDQGTAIHNISNALRLEGHLDVAALEWSFTELIRRHETLRTTFAQRDEEPVQCIHPVDEMKLSILDLSQQSESQRHSEVQRLAAAEASRPCDLAQGPLLRASLLRLGKHEHVLLLTIHHIIADGWSIGVFIRELSLLYQTYCSGEPSPLAELPIQYADFAAWQRNWLQGEVLETQLRYWREQLKGHLPVLELPTDRARPAVQTFRGAHHPISLPPELSKALQSLSQRAGVTLFMTLLAAFQVLLSRYSGQDDILVGSPIANRNRVEIEGLIGFFTNTLVLRTNLADNPTFRELLLRVRQMALDAYAHQDLPFEKLVDELHPQRDLSRSPLFQVMFVLQNMPMSTIELPGLKLQVVDFERQTSKFDLTLLLWEGEQNLEGVLEYNTDLFDGNTIERMCGNFETLLKHIVDNPDQPIKALPILAKADQRKLKAWNDTDDSVDLHEKNILELIEAQVENNPQCIAVTTDRHALTYADLNRRANQLARYLRSFGVGPDVMVGLCVNRAVEMLVGILGILKAGGAYVPLDPAWPSARLAFAVEDTQMPVLLTQQQLLRQLPENGPQIFCLDSNWAENASNDVENLEHIAQPDHLAYLIYTSGSTGTPKGVLVSRSHLAHSIGNHLTYYADNPVGGYLLLSPFAFDSSVTGIFWTLCQGGNLVLPPDDFVEDITCLARLIAKHRLSHLVCVPSLYGLILSELDLVQLATLRCVIVAGEVCPKDLVEQHYQLLPQATLYNEYGPTECSVWSSVYRCQIDDPHIQVSIGSPIQNTQMHVLDERLQRVPIGVVGEIYIGGRGVTYGYLNQPELTAERFLPNPFSIQNGERLYKTGDLGRYLADGNLEFMGRCDDQVKLHGFRIELDEIEAILRKHPRVSEAVASISQHREQLLAYIVKDGEARFDHEELRSFLQEQLPTYMVPSIFISIEKLPRTTTGKIDRRALPEPEITPVGDCFEAPRNAKEQVLVKIWTALLGLERVGIHDNFFALGGDSIISIQVVSRARQSGIHLSPKQIFQHQTIAELAQASSTSSRIQAEQGLVTGPVPLTPIQHWFFEQDFANPHHFNQAILFETRQPLDTAILEQAWGVLFKHHDGLRMRFQCSEVGWLQNNTGTQDTIPFTHADLSTMPETQQKATIEDQISALHTSLDLLNGPLARLAYWDLGPEQPGRLFIVIHHLVVDGVSWRILTEDLEQVYGQISRGEMVYLPPKTTSFQQWAEQLKAYAQLEKLRLEMTEWLEQDWERAVSLPLDDPEAENTVALEQAVSVSLSQSETQALLQDVPWVYRTQINDVLLTALAIAWRDWSGERTLLVDLEGHGRDEIVEGLDLSRTVGWFTAVYPVLLDLEGVHSTREALLSIKAQLQQIPQNGIGYGLLRYLNPESCSTIQNLPQAQVLFNYLGQMDQSLSTALLQPAQESSGPSRSPMGTRAYLLEINSSIYGGQLHLVWSYGKNLQARATIEQLANKYLEALQQIIAHCQSAQRGEISATDFPAARLSQNELERLLRAIE